MGEPKERAYIVVGGRQYTVHTDADLLDAIADAVTAAPITVTVGDHMLCYGTINYSDMNYCRVG